jgi:hypothetical protein
MSRATSPAPETTARSGPERVLLKRHSPWPALVVLGLALAIGGGGVLALALASPSKPSYVTKPVGGIRPTTLSALGLTSAWGGQPPPDVLSLPILPSGASVLSYHLNHASSFDLSIEVKDPHSPAQLATFFREVLTRNSLHLLSAGYTKPTVFTVTARFPSSTGDYYLVSIQLQAASTAVASSYFELRLIDEPPES